MPFQELGAIHSLFRSNARVISPCRYLVSYPMILEVELFSQCKILATLTEELLGSSPKYKRGGSAHSQVGKNVGPTCSNVRLGSIRNV